MYINGKFILFAHLYALNLWHLIMYDEICGLLPTTAGFVARKPDINKAFNSIGQIHIIIKNFIKLEKQLMNHITWLLQYYVVTKKKEKSLKILC